MAVLESLEEQKLRLEIRELERPFWQRPAVVSASVAIAITLIGGHLTGWFDLEFKRLEVQRQTIANEIVAISQKRDQKSKELNDLAVAFQGLQNSYIRLQSQLADVTIEKELSAAQLRQLREQTDARNQTIAEQRQNISILQKRVLELASQDSDVTVVAQPTFRALGGVRGRAISTDDEGRTILPEARDGTSEGAAAFLGQKH